eukprot:COSAG01_NODE_534_length_15805_cov_9.468420_10_plen_109_part_00
MIVLLVILLVLTGVIGGGDNPDKGRLPTPDHFKDSATIMRYRLLVQKDCVPDDCAQDTPGDNCIKWSKDFNQALVNALNDETDGIKAEHPSDPESDYSVDPDDVHVAK